VQALETAVLQLDQKIEKTGTAAAAAAEEARGVAKLQSAQPQAAAPSPRTQSELSRAFSVAEKALQTATGLESRVKILESGGDGVGVKGLSERVERVEAEAKKMREQQANDV
jgi:hypothetical protein